MKAIVLKETRNIQKYINSMTAKDELLRECLKHIETLERDQAQEVPWRSLHRLYHRRIAEADNTDKSH